MLFRKTIHVLLFACLAVPSLGSDMFNSLTSGKDFCVDVDSFFDPSNTTERQTGDVACNTGDVYGNRLDISFLAGFFPDLLNGIQFSLELGASCFPLEIVNDGANNATVLELQNGETCFNVLAAASSAIAPGQAKKLCIGNTCSRRRNLLEDAVTLQPEDALYHDVSELCADHEYEVSLYVDSHMMAVASPTQDAISDGCPLVATHAKFNHDSNKFEKETLAWMSNHQAVDGAFSRGSYFIGNFKGSELIKAHESISQIGAGDQKGYDVVSNNCASFMLDLANNLGVKIDSRLTMFVARRLIESSSKDFVDKIRNSVNFKSLLHYGRNLRAAETADAASDEELIHLLVRKNAPGIQ